MRALWLLACALCLMAGLSLAATRPGGVKRWDRGGIIVYAAPAEGAPQTSLSLIFRAGRGLDPVGKRGCADVSAAWIAAALEPVVAAWSGRVEVEISPWWVRFSLAVPSGDQAAALGQVAAAIAGASQEHRPLAPLIEAASRLARAQDPRAETWRPLSDRLLGAAVPGQMPSQAELSALDLSDVRAFIDHIYVRNNLWLALGSPSPPEALDPWVDEAFSAWRRQPVSLPPPRVPPPAAPGWSEAEGLAAPVALVGGLGVGRWDPDRHAAEVLLAVVNNHVNALAPEAGAELRPGDPDVWWAFAPLDHRDALEQLLSALAGGAITDSEVAAARVDVSAQRSTAMRSPGQLATAHAIQEAMGYSGDQWSQDLKQLDRVRGADVRRLARRWFDGGALVGIAVRRPPS